MTRPKTVEQKIGEWQRAYTAVVEELEYVPKAWPKQAGIEVMYAGRRTAAIVAAMLVGQNVRVPEPAHDPLDMTDEWNEP